MNAFPSISALVRASLSLLLALAFSSVPLLAADMFERIHDATKILDTRQGSVQPIPTELLLNAKGVAICTVTKFGLGLGGQGGEGIVLIRHRVGDVLPVWRAPSAFNLSGGSIGAQFGISVTRYIILLNTEEAIGQFVGAGKIKWDATAAGTAGDDTVAASESTKQLEAHSVLVYKDSGGLFGGATLGGSSIEVSDETNQDAYGRSIYVRDILEGRVPIPTGATRLYELLEGKR